MRISSSVTASRSASRMWYGGPTLGFFTIKKSYVHKMAGRLVGETVDSHGQRAYVLTLTAREQHIKRERATSNICTNQGLLALASAVYMSVLGKSGLRQVAELCYHKAHYAAEQLSKIKGMGLCFTRAVLPRVRLVCQSACVRSQRAFARRMTSSADTTSARIIPPSRITC